MGSERYDELHGSNNWAGLLDPLDLDLRNLLLGYGDLSSAAEREFNKNEGSLYNGYCYYGKSSFFKGIILPWADSKYKVTSFIYATAHVNSVLPLLDPGMSREGSEFDSNWMGYIAVSSDDYIKFIGRREICMVWRGTDTTYEWIDDIVGAEPCPNINVSAFDIAMNVVTPDINVSAFVFASPQVGNQSFKSKMEELPNLKVLRVKNDPDIVLFWPSKILKWGMLHTLSGWNGKDGDFDWGLVKRSLGWVNMSTDLLRKEFKVPVNWWAEKNRGMVLNEYGDWVLSPLDRRDHDLPV
ncbi:hypothetical protein L1987_53494 [Smallanthus sonchifolius]|uniref:Uncharacterized protein n=1 Tax=Smallanthus sonchifolius TaxID=185202 RepID=A0ACB9EWE7_9ASTR|nr:hypothetical protein L1987_53494 [Smallanthus sonchifolius]